MALPDRLLAAFALLAAAPERAMARRALAHHLGRSEKQLRRLFLDYAAYRRRAPALPFELPVLIEEMRGGRKWWRLADPTPSDDA